MARPEPAASRLVEGGEVERAEAVGVGNHVDLGRTRTEAFDH